MDYIADTFMEKETLGVVSGECLGNFSWTMLPNDQIMTSSLSLARKASNFELSDCTKLGENKLIARRHYNGKWYINYEGLISLYYEMSDDIQENGHKSAYMNCFYIVELMYGCRFFLSSGSISLEESEQLCVEEAKLFNV